MNLWSEEEEKKQYQEIIDRPTLKPEELWSLSKDNFHKWRIKYDYPKLIASFNSHKPNFVKWKKEFKIEDETLMDCSITSLITGKRNAKDYTLYILEQSFDNNKRLLVARDDFSRNPPPHLQNNESYKLIKKVISYSDWCKKNKYKNDIFNIKSRQGFSSEKVWLDSGYELLNMGGIEAQYNMFGLRLIGRSIEFVNMCGLKFIGPLPISMSSQLTLSYSAFDNVICSDIELSLMQFNNCSIEDISIKNCIINSTRFWECETTGEIIDSRLNTVDVYGGKFTPIIKNTHIIDVQSEHKNYWNTNFSYTYSNLKKIYADQGNDSEAKKYYIKEKELYREFSKGWNFIVKSLSYYYWGYGKKPQNIIYSGLLIILACSLIYYSFPYLVKPVAEPKDFIDSIYFSTVTFTTLGYGDLSPIGWVRIVALLEAFFGAFSIGFLVAGYSNSKY